MKGIEQRAVNGENIVVGIVKARWNKEIIDLLYERSVDALKDNGVIEKNIITKEVPGSYELTFGADILLRIYKVDVVICLGVLIKGETAHFDYISQSVAQGISRVSIKHEKPAIFGVLTCFNEDQALIRAKKDGMDHGYEWGLSALEMARLKD